MLPGCFVERGRRCGKPNCRCASGKAEDRHPQLALSVLIDGKLKTIHLTAALAKEARRGVELHRRFKELEARICAINLARLSRKKQSPPQS
jgi:hypothetical protein